MCKSSQETHRIEIPLETDQTRLGGKDIRNVYHVQRNVRKRGSLGCNAVWIEHRRRTIAVSILSASLRRTAVCVCPVDLLEAKLSGIDLAIPKMMWEQPRSTVKLGFGVVLTSVKAFHADATYVRTRLCLLHVKSVSFEMNSDKAVRNNLWPSRLAWCFLTMASS